MSDDLLSSSQLPWALSNDDSRFKKILSAGVVLLLLVAVPVMVVKVPELTRAEKSELPPQLARVMIEKLELPQPKPVEPPHKPKPVEVKQLPPTEVKKVEEPKQLSESQAKKEALADRKPLTESAMKARETAKKTGVLAMANELNDLVDNTHPNTTSVIGHLSKDTAGRNMAVGHDASVVTSDVSQGGGQVKAGGTDISKTQLAERDAAQVKSDLFAKEAAGNGGKGPGGRARTEEDVAIVFEKNKSALNAFYERERRKTPGLQGKIVFQLTISPAGDVTQVKVLSSDLNNPDLEAKLMARIKLFKFEPRGTAPVTINYPIELLPV